VLLLKVHLGARLSVSTILITLSRISQASLQMNITTRPDHQYFLQGSIFPMSHMHDESYTEQSPSPSVQMPNRCSKATPTMYQPDLWDLPLTGRTKHCRRFFLIANEKEHVPSQPPSPKVIDREKLECTAVVSSNRTQPIASWSCRQPLRSFGHRIVVFVQSSCGHSMRHP